MDFKSLIDNLQTLQPTEKFQKKKKESEFNGYYILPCTKEPFDGAVIKLSGEEFNALFQTWGQDEFRFREKLWKYDEWFETKAYKVQQNWLKLITTWMQKDEQEKISRSAR